MLIIHDKYNGVSEDPKQQQQQKQQHQQHQQQQQQQQHQQHQHQQQQQQHQHANSPLFPASHPHISGQLNSSDHRPSQNGVHSTQRAIAPDMRLPSIKHFENITNIQHSSSSVKQHQSYPSQPQTANMHIHSQPPPNYNTSKPMSNGI